MTWRKTITTSEAAPSWRDSISTEQELPSELESALRGLAQGASFGFSDEMTGAVESIFTDKTYQQSRDESRQNNLEAQTANPTSYMAGEIGAAVGTTFIPGLGVLNAGKGARLAEIATKAALQGGLTGAGLSNEEDISGIARDTIQGATIGGAMGATASKASDLISGAVSKVGNKIDDNILLKKLGKGVFGVDEKATENYLANPARVNSAYSMGELAEGVLDKSDNTSVLNELRTKSSELSNTAWKTLDSKAGLDKSLINEAINSYIDDPKSGLLIDGVVVGNAQEMALKKLEALKKQIGQLGNNISEENLKRIIQNLDDNINWNAPDAGPTNDAIKNLRTFIDVNLKDQNPAYKKAMSAVEDVTKANEQVKSVFQNRLNPDNYDKFNKAVKNLINKDELSAASQAVDKIKEHTNYDLRQDIYDSWTKSQFDKGDINGSRRTLLGTVIGGSVGSAGGPVGSTVGGAVGGAVGFTSDRYAGPMFKSLLNGKLSMDNFISQHGQVLGKFTKPLKEAASRGNQALAATHFILASRNPEYRQMIEDLEKEK